MTDVNTSLPVTLDDGSRKYVWGLGLAYAVSGSSVEIYHTDRLGSVRAITDASGAVTVTYLTDEYGVPTATTGSTTQPFGYTGEPRDATGLSYLRARYYDPALGRFMSRDSWAGLAGGAGSLNRFTYVENNPASANDPAGHWLNILVGGVIGSIAGLGGYVVGSVATGQVPDLQQAAIATAGGAITGGVCGATLGVVCLAAGALTSVAQYQASPGATNPIADPLPYAFNATIGAVLGRVTGGAVLRPGVVTWSAHVVPSAIERFSRNYPRWWQALGPSFFKSLLASSSQTIVGNALNPPPVAASSRVKAQP